MDLTQFALASFGLIGLVNWVNFLLEKEYKSFIKATIAIAAGTAFGYFHWLGLPSMEMGFAVGISSSGVYKVAQMVTDQNKKT